MYTRAQGESGGRCEGAGGARAGECRLLGDPGAPSPPPRCAPVSACVTGEGWAGREACAREGQLRAGQRLCGLRFPPVRPEEEKLPSALPVSHERRGVEWPFLKPDPGPVGSPLCAPKKALLQAAGGGRGGGAQGGRGTQHSQRRGCQLGGRPHQAGGLHSLSGAGAPPTALLPPPPPAPASPPPTPPIPSPAP